MRHENYDLTNPEVRAAYFIPSLGRPSDELIIEEVRETVRQLRKHHQPHVECKSSELCPAIWDEYTVHHHYIGQRIKVLTKGGKLPITRVGKTGDKYALYTING
jgi:hypothetical protein